ncbi:MAG: hypothetical protein ACU0DK_14385 [Pseudooceanicola sp.]
MIVANLATYPPRLSNLGAVVERIAPQVDRLNVVLNEFDSVPAFLEGRDNVVAVIPEHDTKDVGKFYPDVSGAEYVLLIDDDLVYPADYVARTVERFVAAARGGRLMAGYHGSVYRRPRPSLNPGTMLAWMRYDPSRIADYRRIYTFDQGMAEATILDQVATGVAILRGPDLPPYAYMRDSQKFVDVRMAKWCHEHDIPRIGLPKPENWITAVKFRETIFRGFTRKNPPQVAAEIWEYAFKTEGAGRAWSAAA